MQLWEKMQLQEPQTCTSQVWGLVCMLNSEGQHQQCNQANIDVSSLTTNLCLLKLRTQSQHSLSEMCKHLCQAYPSQELYPSKNLATKLLAGIGLLLLFLFPIFQMLKSLSVPAPSNLQAPLSCAFWPDTSQRKKKTLASRAAHNTQHPSRELVFEE